MSTYYYFLRIRIPEDVKHELITDVLKTKPTKTTKKRWELELIEHNGHIDFVSTFVKIIDMQKLEALNTMGISRDAISIWLNYEYDSQCNIEISPQDMKKLGELNLPLCISCWQK